MSVCVIAGLGNPGSEYERTRHNIGFRVVDALASAHSAQPWQKESRFKALVSKIELNGQTIWLLKPLTFMNRSGEAVSRFIRYFRLASPAVLVVYDEYQIPVGEMKVSHRGGAGGHNGVADLLQHLGSDFIRFRIGIGSQEKSHADMKDFVLGKFSPDDESILESAMPRFLDGLRLVVDVGPLRAMNDLNRRHTIKLKKSHDGNEESKLSGHRDPRHAGLRSTGGNPEREASGSPGRPGGEGLGDDAAGPA